MSIEANPRRAALPVVAVGVAVAALLAGCSYRMDRIDNPVKMPVAWDAMNTPNAKEGVQNDWWTGFSSPVLEKLIAQALQDNPSLIVTEERLKQAERTLSGARDGLFPELSVNASTGKGQTTTKGSAIALLDGTSKTESSSTSLALRYNVDLWGATAARYRASVATFIGTRYDTDLARIQLASNVARDYFNLLSVRSRVDIARENLAIAERLLRIIDSRYRNGTIRLYDLTQQTTTVLQQRTALIPLENQLRQAETALGLLLGVTPQEFHIEGEPIEQLKVPEIAPWLPGDMLLRRPDIAAAETDMAAARANMVVARASLIPVSLSLSATGTSTSTDLLSLGDARTYSVQGLLTLATGIFDYRARHNSYLNAKSNEYIALVNYGQTIRTALKEVDDDLASVEANLRAEESQKATVDQAQKALDLASVGLREGSQGIEDVLNAQRTLFTAKDSLAQARLTRLTSAVTLYVALGGGWTAPSEPEASTGSK
ncbi:MAG: efflux transporter outer membrane subunit [Pseudomonadota bacterium]